MNTSRLTAGASRFAHFAGFTRNSRRASDDKDDDQPQGKRSRADDGDDDDDQPKGKRSRADDGDDDDQPQGKRSRADDGNDDDDQPKGKRSRADDGDEDDDDKPKSKRSRADDGDDDDDQPKGKRSRASDDDDDGPDAEDDDEDELNGKGANASARRREQARISHILGHSAAANNLPLAVSLACETRMTRKAAVRVLRGQAGSGNGASARDDAPRNRHARADRQDRNVVLGSDAAAPTGRQAVKASWGAAFEKAGVKLG